VRAGSTELDLLYLNCQRLAFLWNMFTPSE
jgi:hypothetical protein